MIIQKENSLCVIPCKMIQISKNFPGDPTRISFGYLAHINEEGKC